MKVRIQANTGVTAKLLANRPDKA